MPRFPQYVALGCTCLRLTAARMVKKTPVATYYRDAGNWSIDAVQKRGALQVHGRFFTGTNVSNAHVRDAVLTPVSEARWRRDNEGYVTRGERAATAKEIEQQLTAKPKMSPVDDAPPF